VRTGWRGGECGGAGGGGGGVGGGLVGFFWEFRGPVGPVRVVLAGLNG